MRLILGTRTIAASIVRMVKFIQLLHLLGAERLDQTCKCHIRTQDYSHLKVALLNNFRLRLCGSYVVLGNHRSLSRYHQRMSAYHPPRVPRHVARVCHTLCP